jgi:hypothetical protein
MDGGLLHLDQNVVGWEETGSLNMTCDPFDSVVGMPVCRLCPLLRELSHRRSVALLVISTRPYQLHA